MEEPNIHKAEEEGRRGFQAAQNRFSGLLKDAVPPGLETPDELGELNELDLIAHRYREAFEIVKPLIENPEVIKAGLEEIHIDASEGRRKENTVSAWYAARKVFVFRALDIWHRGDREIQKQIEVYFDDKTFIDNATKAVLDFPTSSSETKRDYVWDAIVGASVSNIRGLWNRAIKKKRKELEGYLKNKKFIDAVAEEVRLNAKDAVEGKGKGTMYQYACATADGVAALIISGIWDKLHRETRVEIEGYLKNQEFINRVAEEIHSKYAKSLTKKGYTSVWVVALDAFALKTLAEYYEREAEKLRSTQGADAARKPQGDVNLSDILPAKAF